MAGSEAPVLCVGHTWTLLGMQLLELYETGFPQGSLKPGASPQACVHNLWVWAMFGSEHIGWSAGRMRLGARIPESRGMTGTGSELDCAEPLRKGVQCSAFCSCGGGPAMGKGHSGELGLVCCVSLDFKLWLFAYWNVSIGNSKPENG